jgi:hypothetical protein
MIGAVPWRDDVERRRGPASGTGATGRLRQACRCAMSICGSAAQRAEERQRECPPAIGQRVREVAEVWTSRRPGPAWGVWRARGRWRRRHPSCNGDAARGGRARGSAWSRRGNPPHAHACSWYGDDVQMRAGHKELRRIASGSLGDDLTALATTMCWRRPSNLWGLVWTLA